MSGSLLLRALSLLVATALVVGPWALAWPVDERELVAFGRYGYAQFVVGVLAGIAALAVVVIALVPGDGRRRAVFRAVAGVLGLLVALGLGELVAVVLPPKANPFYTHNEGGLAAGRPADPAIPYLRPPHLDWSGVTFGDIPEWRVGDVPERAVTLRTDQDGFRNPADLTRADVVFVGDSFTEGGNVAVEDTIPQQVARRLEASVRNLGLFGLGPPEELAVLRQFGLPCAPRVVVWQFCEGNDLLDAWRYDLRMYSLTLGEDTRGAQSSYRVSAWQQRSPTHTLFRALAPPKRNWPGGDFVTADGERHEIRFGYWPRTEKHVPLADSTTKWWPAPHPGWGPTKGALETAHALLTEAGVALIVTYVPMKMTVMGDSVEFDAWTRLWAEPGWDGVWNLLPEDRTLGAALAAECDRLGVPFVNPTEALRAATRAGELVYDPADTHLSPRGYALVAELLAPWVRQALAR